MDSEIITNDDIDRLISMTVELNKAKEEYISKIMRLTGIKYSEAGLWLDKLIAIHSLPKLNIK